VCIYICIANKSCWVRDQVSLIRLFAFQVLIFKGRDQMEQKLKLWNNSFSIEKLEQQYISTWSIWRILVGILDGYFKQSLMILMEKPSSDASLSYNAIDSSYFLYFASRNILTLMFYFITIPLKIIRCGQIKLFSLFRLSQVNVLFDHIPVKLISK